MLTAEMARQSCLASAARWRGQAEQVREHAERSDLLPRQREALLAEAEACGRQADWWVQGADDHLPAAAPAGLATLPQ
ncbi:hypothetical protein ROTAS13_03664 [Roseomonas sp. TAS13]|uniref:hypothetical protein n=1 Tax=Roseomonas TaxID=125216 RepID=UPI000963E82D|nr:MULTISPECIES: hypothetical protein [Roseomonas]MCG7352615.1 hypothetical protein [Roseomonas mucosa]MCG7358253.1 hypothetical protein [Roseomonas mucosa]GAV35981.1 hypothetical protein ROTAS13_03664 [Roseomonas sp. TAS13]